MRETGGTQKRLDFDFILNGYQQCADVYIAGSAPESKSNYASRRLRPQP